MLCQDFPRCRKEVKDCNLDVRKRNESHKKLKDP